MSCDNCISSEVKGTVTCYLHCKEFDEAVSPDDYCERYEPKDGWAKEEQS